MKKIGIIGGMGPLATVDLMQKMILCTHAKTDQDYPRIFVDCNTNIPDRTAAILGSGQDPTVLMCESAKKLEQMGADVLCMPCNTAHYFYNNIGAEVTVPIVHMIEQTMLYIKSSPYKKVALLATDGTIKTGLYEKFAKQHNINMQNIQCEDQKIVMSLIYDCVKASNWDFPIDSFTMMLNKYIGQGVEAFVLGCTELPIAFEHYNISVIGIDPTKILAKVVVEYAGYSTK